MCRVLERFHFAIALVLLSTTQALNAQSTYGSVVGNVVDPQKGVVIGAEVRLTETQTNVARATKTTEFGTYEFVNLNQGTYAVEVNAPGFAVFKTQPFELAARQTIRIDAELRPASV